MNLDKGESIALAIIATALIVGFITCVIIPNISDSTNQSILKEYESNQFALIGDEVLNDTHFRVMLIVDQKTGVEYAIVAGEITPRYNPDGSFIIHPEYMEVEK